MHNILPDDTLLHIGMFLNQKDFAYYLIALGRRFSSIKQNPAEKINLSTSKYRLLTINAAGKLMNAVHHAAYNQAKKIITADPYLIFKPIHYLFPNGRSELLCPLEYAIKIYDSDMVKLFYEHLKHNKTHREKFFNLLSKPIQQINLTPLLRSYEEYIRLRTLWWEDETSDSELDQAWFQLCATQKELLPFHLLKELATANTAPNSKSTFDIHNLSGEDTTWAYDARTKTLKSLLSFELDSAWGKSCAFLRSSNGRPDGIKSLSFDKQHYSISDDSQILRQQFERKKAALDSLQLSRTNTLEDDLQQLKLRS